MNETGLLYDGNDKRQLCMNCVPDVESRYLYELAKKESGDILCEDVIRTIAEYTKGYVFQCGNSKCSETIVINNYNAFRANWYSGDDNQTNYAFYFYIVDDKYVKRPSIRDECVFMYGKWMRLFCGHCWDNKTSRKCRKRMGPSRKSNRCANYEIEAGLYDGKCLNHPCCSHCGFAWPRRWWMRIDYKSKSFLNEAECKDCGTFIICAECEEKDIYLEKYGKCRHCYDKKYKQRLYDMILSNAYLAKEESIVNVILNYSYGNILKCNVCKCKIVVPNINKDVNDLDSKVDLNGTLFYYYCVDDKYVNDDTIDALCYTNKYYGYIRMFCRGCVGNLDADYGKCKYCDNVDGGDKTCSWNSEYKKGRKYKNIPKHWYSICYNHGRVIHYECDECGVCGYDAKEHVFTEYCPLCKRNLCISCMNHPKHGRHQWEKERIKYGLDLDDMNDEYLVFDTKESLRDKRWSMKRQKTMDKERKARKLNDPYWRRKIDKQRNKKSIAKWNKQYLLSLYGY